MDGAAPEVLDAPLPDEPGEVVLASLPRWMHALPERGPPSEEQAQADLGAAQDDMEDRPPDW